MGFPKNQSLVSDRNVARCRGEGRSGFTKQNNFRVKMIYGCIEDISITENFLMHQRIGVERTLHPACVRAKDLVGYLAQPEALCLLGMFQSHCAMRNQMKKVLKTLCFTFPGRNITLPVEFSNASICILKDSTRKPSADDNAFEAADEAFRF